MDGPQANDARGCQVEWYVARSDLQQDRFDVPQRAKQCADGDPGCDYDPTSGSCGFKMVVCLNNSDPNLTACTPTALAPYTSSGRESVRECLKFSAMRFPTTGRNAERTATPAQSDESVPHATDARADTVTRLRQRAASDCGRAEFLQRAVRHYRSAGGSQASFARPQDVVVQPGATAAGERIACDTEVREKLVSTAVRNYDHPVRKST